MGTTLANLAVRGSIEKVKSVLVGTKCYLASDERNTYIFPDNDTFGEVSALAQRLSLDLNTVSVCGEIYDSDSVHVAFYCNGEQIFDYDWYEQDEPEIQGDVEKVFEAMEFGGAKDEYVEMLKKRESFAEYKYEKLVGPFGFSSSLPITSYGFIDEHGVDKHNEGEDLKVELFN